MNAMTRRQAVRSTGHAAIIGATAAASTATPARGRREATVATIIAVARTRAPRTTWRIC